MSISEVVVPEFPYKRTFMNEPMYYFDNLRTKSYLMSNEFIPVKKYILWRYRGRDNINLFPPQ